MADYSEELAFALEIATDAGAIAMARFGGEHQSKVKADGSWATESDLAAETAIRTAIAAKYPTHNIFGEEEGLASASGGAAADGAPTWVVDPIDGTNNYMTAIPIWATLVGLRIGTETVVGVCNAPAINELYDAALGSGARMNGSPISVSDTASLSDAFVIHASVRRLYEYGLDDLYNTLILNSARDRGFGDFWGHMLVARGAADVMVEPELALWDVAALQPIISEAGGRLTKITGEAWLDGGSVLTTNGSLHDEIVAIASADR